MKLAGRSKSTAQTTRCEIGTERKNAYFARLRFALIPSLASLHETAANAHENQQQHRADSDQHNLDGIE